ncbi:DHA2 family efflux MFS transporter permease subunit [Ralstonia pseudosolanacearum]|uniref:DHA2 family efflux MFS transporter permease subunit n=1 Tax=Ralstonia solanacearum TaxID=305 RepID=A0AA92K233_RALSL|nr:DHA2 family efflux MFS transporter permease subunit [Ralstonia pseudosolanacearum]QOK92012.1 DHA2 family efflux MFS transporter permease subunit [Ralstonia pseudosolanacearum]QOK96995.1 DHA2 family efflux MFS transporter permease subunit [Ralstonia pseudosolanacearum]UWD92494.1 DHA2 family efflux MFS transporter permease subunit [Ralstonia pseudosolanacearum]CAH0440728.1 Multidrug export protein EmrB [Ralstonia pseudosolanacearum]
MTTAAPRPLPPLTGAKLAIGTVALSLATFMNVLDSSIANVSIPAISGDLGVAPNQGTWVITSFAVANAISVPLTGWLTQRFGQVRLFVTSILLFVLSSWACGLAPNMSTLIAARILQGAVAGPMIPLSQSLLLSTYPPAKSSMALALWGMTTLVAPIMGPIFGGWISDNMTWPWIFYINIPVGILAAYATWVIYKDRESPTRALPIDRIGLALLVIWVGSLQLMLDRGKELDWFNSAEIVTLTVVAVVGFAFFLVWELTEEHPVVDLTLFKGRNFSAGVVAISVAYGLFFGNLVILPLWLQTIVGYTATDAGLVMAPVGIFAILLSPVIGKNLPKMDARWVATTAFITFALVFWMRSHFTIQVDTWTLMVPTLIQGAAMAMFFIPLTSIILSGLRPERIPAASGLSNFVRIMFGGIGASISTTVWDNRSALHHAQLVERANPYNPAYASSLGDYTQMGMPNLQANGAIERIISQQAAMMGANDIFWISAVLFIVLIALIWLTHPAKSAAGAEVAAGAH